MTNEHMGTCIYDKGRFELRETDHAIIDLKGDFPPIMIASNTVDDGSELEYADRRGVLHLLNELSDNNPNEEWHWYLKEMLDKAWTQYHEQKEENEQLKQTMHEVGELLSEEVDLFSDKATEHDICAYVELREFDNKDAYYMATATKKAIKILKGDDGNDWKTIYNSRCWNIRPSKETII